MAKGGPHPLTGHLPPDRPHWGGEPLATGHTPPGATLWPKGAPHLRPHRGSGPSPTGHLWPPPPPLATYAHRLPHWPEKRTAPIGKRGATPSPASHWPPTGHLLAIRGGLPLAKGEAPTGQRDGRGEPMATRGGEGTPSPSPPPEKLGGFFMPCGNPFTHSYPHPPNLTHTIPTPLLCG